MPIQSASWSWTTVDSNGIPTNLQLLKPKGGNNVGAAVAAAATATATGIAAAVPAAAPAGGAGLVAGGWDTADNRDLAITTINGLRTHAIEMDLDYEALLVDVAELRTKLNSALTELRALGLITA